MGRNHKKKKTNKPIVNKSEDYNLRDSLKKLNQHQVIPISETSSGIERNKDNQGVINASSLKQQQTNETTGIYIQLNENMNSRYDTLNQSIGDVREKIGTTNKDLRIELEGKINKKLDFQFFIYAIIVLVTITSLIYTFSYKDVVEKTNANEKRIIVNEGKHNIREASNKNGASSSVIESSYPDSTENK